MSGPTSPTIRRARACRDQLGNAIEAVRPTLVVWTERDENVIRIVSARWATAREQSLYHSYRELQS